MRRCDFATDNVSGNNYKTTFGSVLKSRLCIKTLIEVKKRINCNYPKKNFFTQISSNTTESVTEQYRYHKKIEKIVQKKVQGIMKNQKKRKETANGT